MSEDNGKPQGVPRPRYRSSSERETEVRGGEHSVDLRLVTVSPRLASDPDVGSRQPPEVIVRDPYVGATVDDRYKIEAMLGEGGMGVVYRCRHTIIGKKVAMKILRSDLARDQEVTERFLNEARAASAIGNPHIIDISDFGRLPDGSTYFVMEYLEGTPLSDLVREQHPVPVPRILHVARQLAEGLHAAHSQGIVHRDLKPDNIFLISRGAQKDFVKILDFGIAKVSATEGKLTRAGAVFGTPHYMSPEQAAGTVVDHRGDIYSVGVILYELASGKVPFDADNFMGILTQHMYKAPVPIRALVPVPQDVPPGLEAIILKCLSKRGEQRYDTMERLLADLTRLQDGLIPEAVPELMARASSFNVPAEYFKQSARMPAPLPAMGMELVTRNRWPLYAGIASVAAAVGIVVVIFASSSTSPASPQHLTMADPSTLAGHSPPPGGGAAGSVQRGYPSRQVVIAVEPPDAEVFARDQNLGTSPLVLSVKDGEVLQLVVKREGYVSRMIEVDSETNKRWVQLERSRRKTVRTPATSHNRTDPPAGPNEKTSPLVGGEIVNPWAKRR